MPEFGVISGSGLYDIPGLEITGEAAVSTPFGEPSASYRLGRISGKEVAFLPRHGAPHSIQPHRINYRANIWGFRELGVRRIISVGACGGISPGARPGAIVFPDQIIDSTSGRAATFFDREEVVHIDFTDPFCPDLRESLFRAAGVSAPAAETRGTYVCTNGPRLETAAEIKTFASWGADMVGMTAMPEAVLAREARICFSLVAVITNFAAGIGAERLSSAEVVETMRSASGKLKDLFQSFFALDFSAPSCSCRRSLDEAKI